MSDDQASDDRDLDAGDFASWAVGMQGAIRGERGSDVPCGACTACCTSSQFVHVEPDETDTLAHIPAELLFAAPLRPHGHMVLGYNERGHCPLLVDNKCSIYEHRPRTCRTYDCRVFAAAGVEVEGDDQADIARQARRWRFSYPTEADRAAQDAVRAAVTFLESEHEDGAPTNATQLAIRAIETYDDPESSDVRSRDGDVSR
jgi:Fe-S-cluster containining protein